TAAPLPGFSFNVLTAADADATPPPIGSPAILMRHRDDEEHSPGSADPAHDFLEMFTLHADFQTPANSTFTGPTSIPVSEFDSSFCGSDSAALSCIPEPAGASLDALREPIMNRLEYRNFLDHQTLVGNLITDVDGADRAGIRWFELRQSGTGPFLRRGPIRPTRRGAGTARSPWPARATSRSATARRAARCRRASATPGGWRAIRPARCRRARTRSRRARAGTRPPAGAT